MRKFKDVANNKPITVARYNDLVDVELTVKGFKEAGHGGNSYGQGWHGGTLDDFYKACRVGVDTYTSEAAALLDQFTTVVMENYDIDYEYNASYGVPDMAALDADAPEPFYGPTLTMTDRAPVHIYLDTWVSSSVSIANLRMRGIACLALAQCLSIHRPVYSFVVDGASTRNKDSNTVQVVPIPTNPMDISRASFMMCDPMFTRIGMIEGVLGINKLHSDGIPPLKQGRSWQQTHLGNWLAEKEGVENVVHLPMMYGNDRDFADQETCVAWVNKQLERFI